MRLGAVPDRAARHGPSQPLLRETGHGRGDGPIRSATKTGASDAQIPRHHHRRRHRVGDRHRRLHRLRPGPPRRQRGGSRPSAGVGGSGRDLGPGLERRPGNRIQRRPGRELRRERRRHLERRDGQRRRIPRPRATGRPLGRERCGRPDGPGDGLDHDRDVRVDLDPDRGIAVGRHDLDHLGQVAARQPAAHRGPPDRHLPDGDVQADQAGRDPGRGPRRDRLGRHADR